MFLPHLKCRTVECVHKRAAQEREYSRSAQVTMVPALMYSNSTTHSDIKNEPSYICTSPICLHGVERDFILYLSML